MRTTLFIIGFLIFSLFAYWQINDMEQYGTARTITILWFVSYTCIALLSLISAIYPFPKKLFWITASIPFIIALFRYTYIDWSYDNVLYNPSNPAANETGGLIAMTLWLLLLRKINKKFC